MTAVSICMATFNRPRVLDRVLASICIQPLDDVEIIVCDDGPRDDSTWLVCRQYPVRHLRVEREPVYRNPSAARNVAYRAAKGDVLICQSDDVVHARADTIHNLLRAVQPGHFAIATVINTDNEGKPVPCGHPRNPSLTTFTGPENRRPLFFLGALYRKDLYAIGGCEEQFVAPGRDDVYFSDCLVKGLGLQPNFCDALGWHLHHRRPADIVLHCRPSHEVYRRLAAEGHWIASGGPWAMNGD